MTGPAAGAGVSARPRMRNRHLERIRDSMIAGAMRGGLTRDEAERAADRATTLHHWYDLCALELRTRRDRRSRGS